MLDLLSGRNEEQAMSASFPIRKTRKSELLWDAIRPWKSAQTTLVSFHILGLQFHICERDIDLGFHPVSSDMRLQPNIGSDRSWVWKVAADYSESPPTAETLAIRFANSESEWIIVLLVYHGHWRKNWLPDAAQFKAAFEDAQSNNAALLGPAPDGSAKEEKKDEETLAKTEETEATSEDKDGEEKKEE